jgi:hypothetical protein
MEPVDVENHHSDFRIILTCNKCGFIRPSPLLANDDFQVALSVAKNAAKMKEDLLR